MRTLYRLRITHYSGSLYHVNGNLVSIDPWVRIEELYPVYVAIRDYPGTPIFHRDNFELYSRSRSVRIYKEGYDRYRVVLHRYYLNGLGRPFTTTEESVVPLSSIKYCLTAI